MLAGELGTVGTTLKVESEDPSGSVKVTGAGPGRFLTTRSGAVAFILGMISHVVVVAKSWSVRWWGLWFERRRVFVYFVHRTNGETQ